MLHMGGEERIIRLGPGMETEEARKLVKRVLSSFVKTVISGLAQSNSCML